MGPGAVAGQFRPEEGGRKERVCREFGNTYLARIVGAREVQPVRSQQVQVALAGAVVAKAPATMAQALIARLTG
ncbi:hypothetical protein ACIQZB_31220 [Streptomyces sp. NPDC097727]|uniref:hypothetical protein n=1 Tax=Streptomyces sp. NPDC097727 TaxID=3366092 RepID=UPI003804EC36